MKPIKLKVKTSNESYPILIGANLVSKFSNLLSKNSIKFEKCLLVIDKNVPKKKIIQIKKGLKNKEVFTQFIKANEKNKNQKSLDLIVKILLKKNFSREDCLVSVGGGITGDVSGFAAREDLNLLIFQLLYYHKWTLRLVEKLESIPAMAKIL